MLFKREEVMQRVEEVPVWIKGTAFVLFLSWFIGQVVIQYIYGCVIATLASVESEDTTAILRTSPVDEDPDAPLPPYSDKETDVKAPLIQEVQQEVLLLKSKPITSSIRGTMQHLRSHGANGFRGFGIAIIYFVLLHWITAIIGAIAPMNAVVQLLAVVGGQVMLTRISMLWVHVIIATPSSKRWYQRIVTRSVGKKALLPTLAVTLIQLSTPMIPTVVFQVLNPMAIGDIPLEDQTAADRIVAGLKMLAVLFSGLVYFCTVVIPMSIALVRVYAALLPSDETPIVPMDRTFGGLYVSEEDGGNGKLKLKHAWKSFDWNGRVRLIKIWVKMCVMLTAITLVFFMGMGLLGAAGFKASGKSIHN